jgi:hypothetical protein
MTTHVYTCAGGLVLAMFGALALFIWALDLVSMPDPAQFAMEYGRPGHVWHAAESNRREP